MTELSEQEKQELFQKCEDLAAEFAESRRAGVAAEYMRLREIISDAGLDKEYSKRFFGVK